MGDALTGWIARRLDVKYLVTASGASAWTDCHTFASQLARADRLGRRRAFPAV